MSAGGRGQRLRLQGVVDARLLTSKKPRPDNAARGVAQRERRRRDMLDIVAILAVFASLLVVVALSQPLAVRLRLAPVVLLAVIGAAIGAVSGVLAHSASGAPARRVRHACSPTCRSDPRRSFTSSCRC